MGDDSTDTALASVTRQGIWVVLGLISASALGLGFWVLATRLFSTSEVGIAGSLVSLSLLGAAFSILGFEAGIVRFAPRVQHPRALIRTVLGVTGLLAAGVGLVLPLFVVSAGNIDAGLLWPLFGLSIVLTISTSWVFALNGSFLAAGKAQFTAAGALGAGLLKIGLILAIVPAGVVGLVAAYALSLVAFVVAGLLLVPRLWPKENPTGTPHSLREVATLSLGNWISTFGTYLPGLVAPALILLAYDATAAAFTFLAIQVAEILTYGSEALAKSLFAHGSREDRLSRSLAARVRNRILLLLLPLVALGVVAAPLIGSIVAGAEFGAHPLYLQLFLLATLPRGSYQVLLVQLNVARRSLALAVCGATSGVLTLGVLSIGLFLRFRADLLPSAWIVGGLGALIIGTWLIRRSPDTTEPSPSV